MASRPTPAATASRPAWVRWLFIWLTTAASLSINITFAVFIFRALAASIHCAPVSPSRSVSPGQPPQLTCSIQHQGIANPVLTHQPLRLVQIQLNLSAQGADKLLQAVLADRGVLAPDVGADHGMREHPPPVPRQVHQQSKLSLGQVNFF